MFGLTVCRFCLKITLDQERNIVGRGLCNIVFIPFLKLNSFFDVSFVYLHIPKRFLKKRLHEAEI